MSSGYVDHLILCLYINLYILLISLLKNHLSYNLYTTKCTHVLNINFEKFYTHVNSHHNQDLKHIKLSKGFCYICFLGENLPGPTTGNNSSQQFSRIPCKWRHSLYSMSGIFCSAQHFVSCLIGI